MELEQEVDVRAHYPHRVQARARLPRDRGQKAGQESRDRGVDSGLAASCRPDDVNVETISHRGKLGASGRTIHHQIHARGSLIHATVVDERTLAGLARFLSRLKSH